MGRLAATRAAHPRRLTGGVAESVDLLVSPRDGQSYVIPYGAEGQKLAAKGVAAYEKQGVDGRRQVAFTIGMVEEADEARLQEILTVP